MYYTTINNKQYIYIYSWGATPNSDQCLLLALCSGVIPAIAWGTIRDAGDKIWVDCMQGKCSTLCAMALVP